MPVDEPGVTGTGGQDASGAAARPADGGPGEPHVPVLLREVLAWLEPRPGGRYVDGTVGAGGHARALLEAAGGRAELLAIDRDPEALRVAAGRLAPYRDRVRFVRGDYRDLDRILDEAGWSRVDGILLDLGVSSLQLDDPRRGFSYQADGPLDMRMDPAQPLTAADLVNRASREELADWIRRYGEERWAGRIADFIVAERQRRPITTTGHLVEVIKAAIPARARRQGPHPARRTFQALRIAVNRELEGLEEALARAAHRLAPGGRLVTISFHSLEDRAVKQAFRRLDAGGGFRVLTRKPVTPGEDEVARNPRARSARLRALAREETGGPGEAAAGTGQRGGAGTGT